MPAFPARGLQPYYDELRAWLFAGHNDDGSHDTSELDTLAEDVATNAADIADRARKGRIEALDYGDLSSDTADAAANVTTLQAAATAAGALRADVVVPGMSIPINDEVAFPAYAGLVGAGREATVFLATHADARLTFTEASWATIADFTFDGDMTATQGVMVTGNTHKLALRNVLVRDVAGRSFRLHNVQNSTFDNLDIAGSTYGLEVLDGCGSCTFDALASNSNEYFQLKIGTTGEVISGYNQPYHPIFKAPVLEFYSASTSNSIAALVVTGVTSVEFYNAVFGGPYDKPAVHMSVNTFTGNGTNGVLGVDYNTSSTMTVFDSEATGDPADARGYYLTGQSGIHYVGRNAITGALTGIVLDGSAPRILGDLPEMNSVGTSYTFSGGASYQTNVVRTINNWLDIVALDDNADVLRVTRPAGAGVTISVQSDGKVQWGTSFGARDTNLYREWVQRLKTDHQFTAAMGLTTKAMAGIPTDGDVPSADPGTIIFDDTNDRLYVKCTGGWKYVTLT